MTETQTEPTEHELLRLIQSGDHKAFEVLLKRYRGYLRPIYRRHITYFAPEDELEQIASIIFHKACLAYNFTTAFYSYISRTVRLRLIDWYRLEFGRSDFLRSNRLAMSLTQPNDAVHEKPDRSTPIPDVVAEREWVETHRALLLPLLSDLDTTVYEQMCKGGEQTDIAKRLGMKVHIIGNAVARMKRAAAMIDRQIEDKRLNTKAVGQSDMERARLKQLLKPDYWAVYQTLSKGLTQKATANILSTNRSAVERAVRAIKKASKIIKDQDRASANKTQ
jgi:DNA-directed RNA polymerase specialized sigma24 family protein